MRNPALHQNVQEHRHPRKFSCVPAQLIPVRTPTPAATDLISNFIDEVSEFRMIGPIVRSLFLDFLTFTHVFISVIRSVM